MGGDTTDSDSDESMIPPTPNAKSTPIPHLLKREPVTSNDTSSEESEEGDQNTNGPLPAQKESSSGSEESSSDEDEYANQPIKVSVKREPVTHETSDSSEESDNEESQLYSKATQDTSSDDDVPASKNESSGNHSRLAHTLSASDSDDSPNFAVSRNRTASLNVVRKQEIEDIDERSQQSSAVHYALHKKSDEKVVMHGVSRVVQNESSSDEEESEEEVSKPGPSRVVQNELSSSEDESVEVPKPVTSRAVQNESSSSEEESDEEVPKPGTSTAAQNESSSSEDESDEEVPKPGTSTAAQNESSSSEDESDEVPKPSTSRAVQDESSSSEDDHYNKHQVNVSMVNNIQSKAPDGNTDSTSDDESEEESDTSTRKVPVESVRNPGSSTGSGGKYPPLSAQKTSQKQADSSNSDSSSDESDEPEKQAPATAQLKSGLLKENSDAQIKMEIESTVDDGELRNQNGLSSSDSEDDMWSSNRIQHQVQTPKERGVKLMEEVFREHMPVDLMNTYLGYEDITSEDEVWLIQCPKTMDVSALKKQNLAFGGNTTLQIQEGPTYKRYNVVSQPYASQDFNCVLPSKKSGRFKLINMSVQGKVLIEEHVHVPKLMSPDVPPKTTVPLPPGLKVRHPLLGIGYKEHLKVAEKSIKTDIKQRRKKDKNKSASDSVNMSGSNVTSTDYVDGSFLLPEKKKKRKEATSTENVDGSFLLPEKKKKRKEDTSADNVDGSFLLPEKEKKRKEDTSTDNVDGSFLLSEKKKKRKSNTVDTGALNESGSQKKKHRDSTSFLNQSALNDYHTVTVKTEPLDENLNNNHVSAELLRKKNKKLKKERRESDRGIAELASNQSTHSANGEASYNGKTPNDRTSKKGLYEGVQETLNYQVPLHSKLQEDSETPKMKKSKKSKSHESQPLFMPEIKKEICSDDSDGNRKRKKKRLRESSDGSDYSGQEIKKLKLNDSFTSPDVSQSKKKKFR